MVEFTTKNMKAKGAEIAKRARKEAVNALAIAKRKFSDVEHVVNKKIRNDPEKAVLIAAGIGAAIGAIMTYALARKR